MKLEAKRSENRRAWHGWESFVCKALRCDNRTDDKVVTLSRISESPMALSSLAALHDWLYRAVAEGTKKRTD